MTGMTADNTIFESLGLGTREAPKSSNDELTQEDFMALMVTELTHQDPFKPMENSELASQISQFSVVSGIDRLNQSFDTFSSSMISDQALQASALVGRDVLVPMTTGNLSTGGTIDGVIGLDGSATNVTVMVQDGSGALIREIGLGTRPGGEVGFSWDGLMDSGEYAPPGQYRISARAVQDGQEVAPYLLTEARVDSVSVGSSDGGLTLNLQGLGMIPFQDVAEIR